MFQHSRCYASALAVPSHVRSCIPNRAGFAHLNRSTSCSPQRSSAATSDPTSHGPSSTCSLFATGWSGRCAATWSGGPTLNRPRWQSLGRDQICTLPLYLCHLCSPVPTHLFTYAILCLDSCRPPIPSTMPYSNTASAAEIYAACTSDRRQSNTEDNIRTTSTSPTLFFASPLSALHLLSLSHPCVEIHAGSLILEQGPGEACWLSITGLLADNEGAVLAIRPE